MKTTSDFIFSWSIAAFAALLAGVCTSGNGWLPLAAMIAIVIYCYTVSQRDCESGF